jgi:hypothetical protein
MDRSLEHAFSTMDVASFPLGGFFSWDQLSRLFSKSPLIRLINGLEQNITR